MDSPEPDGLFGEDFDEALSQQSEADEAPLQQIEAEEVPETTEVKVAKPKRDVKKQVLLTENTLRGKRGLTALPSYFERVKFKGKGHEQQDLKAILKTYEYWCYRLFPRRPFDVCVDRIEKLGSRKAVQTYIRRIRFDMVQEDEENLQNNVINDAEDDVENVLPNDFSDNENDQVARTNDQFDQLVSTRTNDAFDQLVNLQLTVDQEEQIRKNKEKAEQLRRVTLQRQASNAMVQSHAAATVMSSQDLFLDHANEHLDIHENSQVSEVMNQDDSLDQGTVTSLVSKQSLFLDHSSDIAGQENIDSEKFTDN